MPLKMGAETQASCKWLGVHDRVLLNTRAASLSPSLSNVVPNGRIGDLPSGEPSATGRRPRDLQPSLPQSRWRGLGVQSETVQMSPGVECDLAALKQVLSGSHHGRLVERACAAVLHPSALTVALQRHDELGIT
jgi:hypothetical protein